MLTAIELLRQGRHEDLWQMCCGFLKYDINQFMAIQKRLLLGQIETLNKSIIGKKLFNGAIIQTIDDFRNDVPLTTYGSYCPELSEKMENVLPGKPAMWVHTSGRSGEFPCKWIPLSPSYIEELSKILYGVGLLAGAKKWGDPSPLCPNMIYTVAPRPYISGAMASMLESQTPLKYYPSLKVAEQLPFEVRIKMGFDEALSGGIDYFFGLSLVLSTVGDKFSQSSKSVDIRPLLSRPRAIARLTKGMIKSRLAGRAMLPKDLWNLKGIITSGLDSSVYRNKIMEYWGRYPLDIYSSTEAGVIATQTWDYEGMTFIPNLNFLEFIPEKEHNKWQQDHKYKPKTILLDEVKSGECYELVLTSFHGGSLVRYRIGDMIRITSLKNEKLGIDLPQMVFERRCDDLLDFAVIRLTEKSVWRAIENLDIPYADWVAYKSPGEMTLNVLLEPLGTRVVNKAELEKKLFEQILKTDSEVYASLKEQEDLAEMIKFKLNLVILPVGTFAEFTNTKRAEGADMAHIKPPHVNPPQKVLAFFLDSLERPSKVVPEPVQKEDRVSVG